MGIFSRRGRRLPDAAPVTVASAGVQTLRSAGAGPVGYTAGWAGLGILNPSQYAGRFDGGQLTQLAGYIDEYQKRQGVEGLSAAWFVAGQLNPATGAALTQQATTATGGLRLLGGSAGSVGPLTATAMRQAVTAAQVRQSGLSAVQWARSLSPNA